MRNLLPVSRFTAPEQYEYGEFATPIIHQSKLFIPVSNVVYGS